ncbi:MAG TPA: aminotransferase class I/II-fold pyridoxal phosphate-dependent enzyme, partial [Nitrospiraceae bacterium]|nr:aminotransferase class I/II-fold pyridoxal phosphate-dependent enzyme [Nitrospiraceae bacterium]
MARDGNRRMAGLAHSEIRAMTAACVRVGGINMAQGVCDTPSPDIVIRAAQRAMESGLNTYTRFDGLAELRQAVAVKLAGYNHLIADPDTEITVSAGATGSFHCACLALLNPGDEVLLFEPAYAYHVSAILAVEAVPRVVPLRAPDWDFLSKDLEQAVTSRTKAIVVNTPGNPSGKVFTRMEVERIAELAERHDLFVFTDEIYEYFLFDGREHVSLASLPGMAERTITIGGYSKTFSITGWRIGYSVAQARWTQLIGAMNDLLYVCAPTPLQYGVGIGIRDLGQSFYTDLIRDYQAKRDRFCKALSGAGLPPS